MDFVRGIRIIFILISMALAAALLLSSGMDTAMPGTLISVFIISEEAVGRWEFYRSRL